MRICAPGEDDMSHTNLDTLPQSVDLEPPRKEADISAEEMNGSGKRESFIIRIPNSDNNLLTGERKSDTASEKMAQDKFEVEDTETNQDVKQKGNTHCKKHCKNTLLLNYFRS